MTVPEALQEIANQLQVEQKGLINKGGSLQAYRTGELHNSLKVEVKPGKEVTSIVSDVVYYGTFVDSGTYKMRARPFVETSVQSVLQAGGYKLLTDAAVFEINAKVDNELKPIKIQS